MKWFLYCRFACGQREFQTSAPVRRCGLRKCARSIAYSTAQRKGLTLFRLGTLHGSDANIVSQWRSLCDPVSKSLVYCAYCLLAAVRSCRHTYLHIYIRHSGIPCRGSSTGSRVTCQPEWRALRIGVQITTVAPRSESCLYFMFALSVGHI